MALLLANGTLAVAALGGGSPRELLEGVITATGRLDGRELALVRVERGRRQSWSSPQGKVLYDTAGTLANVRMSPDGALIALLGSRARYRRVVVADCADCAGVRRVISENWRAIRGLVWSPGGGEIRFAGTKAEAGGSSLFAVNLDGDERH